MVLGQCFPSSCGVLGPATIIKFLPLFLKVIHGFLLFLTSSRRMESDKITGRIELEALRSKLGIDSDEDHG